MSRSELRPNAHVQSARTPARPPAPPAADPPPADPESQVASPAGWRLAALVWAIMFLFLSALALFDLLGGLFRR